MVVRHLAHELRQPLSTIETIACYLEMVLPRHENRARQQMERLNEVVEQAGWILSDSIYFLQASDPRPELIDLDEFISECVACIPGRDSLWIDVALGADPSIVKLDPEQARHMLQNLVHFFRQGSKPNPRLRIAVSRDAGRVNLAFNGQGMVDFNEGELRSMFEPFSPHSPAGSGLALASVHRIVEVHGGEIYWSIGDGQATLVISFPCAKSE